MRSFKKIIPLLQKEHVVKAAIFGSTARGDDTPHSDVDIVVKFGKPKTLFDLVGLQDDLKQLLKKPVDLVTYNSLHPRIKPYILKDQKVIYEERR